MNHKCPSQFNKAQSEENSSLTTSQKTQSFQITMVGNNLNVKEVVNEHLFDILPHLNKSELSNNLC